MGQLSEAPNKSTTFSRNLRNIKLMISDTLIRTHVVFFIFAELFGKNSVYTYEVLKRGIYEKVKNK